MSDERQRSLYEPEPPEDEAGFWAWVEREDWQESHFWKREIQAWVSLEGL